MDASLGFISQVILGFVAIVFYRERCTLLRDFKRLKFASRGLVAECALAKQPWL